MAPHFGFSKVVVADLEAAATFYTTVFGLREQQRIRAAIGGRGIDEVMFAPTASGGATFVLVHFDDTNEPAGGESIVGFITDDVDGVFERAGRAGGTVVQPAEAQPVHGVRVGFFTDPEGHLIEVVEPLPAA